MYTSLKCIPQSLSFWFFLFQFPNGNWILSALYFKKPNILGGVTWVILSLTFTHSALANPVGSSFKMSFIPLAPWCNPRRLLISVAKPPNCVPASTLVSLSPLPHGLFSTPQLDWSFKTVSQIKSLLCAKLSNSHLFPVFPRHLNSAWQITDNKYLLNE